MRLLAISMFLCFQNVLSQVLQPPYFDIARGKKMTATSTCGEGIGSDGKELFCKLAQASGRIGIKGQYCDYCYPGNHSIKYANDGTERWWQSPSLSRGLQYEDVNITIDLGQVYHVAYIIIKAANSPRPGVWSLMRSKDGGRTFTPWYNFASTPSECLTYHKMSHLLPITKDDTVRCKMEYSQVPPFEDGEIHISLVNGRPGASNFSFSPALQEWTTASHIRLHFMKVKTLLGDLMPLSLQDPTVTRRYYYSIKEISVGGRCLCNGFANRCIQVDGDPTNYKCDCQHNACGARCDQCCPGYVQKKWRPRYGNDNFVCERCNCHGHSNKCAYDEQVARRKLSTDINGKKEGGGVCDDCQHNTYGINCEKCRPYYYRPAGVPITSRDACKPCNCSFQTSTGQCADGDGQCNCKSNYAGKKCDRCNVGYFNYPLCEACICDREGSVKGSCAPDNAGNCQCKPGYTGKFCNRCAFGYYGYPTCQPCNCLIQYGALNNECDRKSGQCDCKPGYGSRACDQCLIGYFNFPLCKRCDCDPVKTSAEICAAGSGVCKCRNNYSGLKCDQCADGFYGYPACSPCQCSSTGSSSAPCDKNTGKCTCLQNFRGAKCDQCVSGYYGYPACLACKCDNIGSYGGSCRASDGQCSCRSQYQGRQCNKCQPGFYGFPNCQKCKCNPAGTKSEKNGIDCSSTSNGLCPCKDNVQGKECTVCKDGSFNLQKSNPDGCTNCQCSKAGSMSGLKMCSKLTGQCTCKRHVSERKCMTCQDGFYGLKEVNLFGCKGCECDVGGSVDGNCSKTDGQCKCRDNVTGRKCNEPKPGFYAPTLHQISAEIEDGRAPDGNVVRFDVQESKFPGYSGKGYSMMNEMQPTIIATVNVFKKSNYQIMFKYVLNQLTSVTAQVNVYPSGKRQGLFSGEVGFPTTQTAGSFTSRYSRITKSGDPTFFPLTPGKWDIEISAAPSKLLMDKVILIPEEYVDGKQLNQKVTDPCEVKKDQKVCNQFSYLNMKQQPNFITVEAELNQGQRRPVVLFNDTRVLSELDFTGMAQMSRGNNQLDLDIKVPKSGKYVFVVQYYHDSPTTNVMDLYLRTYRNTQRGRVFLNGCKYKFGCRQVAVNEKTGTVMVYNVNATDRKLVTLLSRYPTTIGIDSVTAIPLEKWNMDYVTPEPLCTTENNKCTITTFSFPKKSIRVDGVSKIGEPVPPNVIDPRSMTYIPSGSIRSLPSKKLPAGRYYIVMHYYQPKHAGFDAQVSVDNVRAYPGVVKFNYCPHTFGCRVVVKNGGGSNVYTLSDVETALRLSVPEGKDVWVDYVLFIPESVYSPMVVMRDPTSRVAEFSKECSKDNFYIKPTVKGFCRDGTFSLTTAFNNGTLACGCDKQGAADQNCEELGGQCRCRSPYITGRTCNRCRMGYFGFPNCQACKTCSNCDEVTGECKCPPGVFGDKCDKCKPGTYGYDQVVGCRPCKCDKTGTVKNADQKCDVATGQCICNENFDGRQCSACRAGFFGFPVCKKCFCNEAGVTEKKCDANSGSCLCKPSVTGPQCDQCVAGNFKTEAKKAANLCLKCWCSGRSKKCSEATRYRKALSKSVQNQPWNMTQHSGKVNFAKSNVAIIQQQNKTQHVYWVSPKEYLNEGVLAYGGYLEFSIQFRTLPGYEKFTLTEGSAPLVVIKGLNSMLHHKRNLQMQDGIKVNVRVPLYESAWVKEDGKPVSRIEFLETITMPKALHVRASHINADKFESSISPVQMSSSGDVGIDRAYGIENCQCPKEYIGTSCEKCAKGYTRFVDGTCVKCDCNGKATDCDPETGVCTGCTGNTMGDKCEKCKPGFYGDKCKPCECPMSSASNNFATSCFLGKGGTMTCRCKLGYTGLRCEKCADGYFGDPLKKGGSCKPCECNGNIDKNLTGNCDPKSGKCFKCLKNTDGEKCENCRIGYYGDAVKAKNCTNCKCDNCGSAKVRCDQKNGQCSCKKNVMGKRCTKCKPNTWNFKACLGCEDCSCGVASMSKQCDTNTGQCKCRPGVMGRKCDWCKLGSFNYTKDGCKKCNCPSGGYCDVFTGSCDCGAAGEKCRLCQPGHIITKSGCVKCDNCVQRLLQRVSFVDLNYSKQLNYSLGISKAKSLALVNQTLQGLGKKADKWSADLETFRKALGYGNYSEFPGSLEYHEVMEFMSCTFIRVKPTSMYPMGGQKATSKKMAPSTTGAPATTMMTSTMMMKKETTANMTLIPGGLVVKPTTAEISINRKKRSLDRQKLIGMRILKRLFRRAVVQDPAVKNITCPASMARVFYETSVNKTLMVMNRLAKRAKMVADNSSATEKRAKDVLANFKGYVKSIEEAVLFANQTLMRLMLGSNDTNVSVSEIQRIRNDLKMRNFTETLLKSGMEKNMARNASMFADDLLNKTMMLFKLVKGQDDTIMKMIKTFLAIDSGAKDALYAAGNGTELVRIAKFIDFQSYVEAARRMIEMYNGTTMHAMNNASAAKMSFDDAAKAFKQFGDNSTTLNNLIVLLRNRVSNLGDHNRNNSKKISKSGNHAKNLKNQAMILESLIKDTKNFSDAAVKAATVYSNIVQGILEALKAAQEANVTALSANLMAQEAKKQAEAGLQRSEIIKAETASLKKDVEGLKKPYDELGMHLAELRALKELVKKKLAAVKDKFPQFEAAKDTGKKADATRIKAQVAASKAKEALDLAKTVKVKIVEANKTFTVLKDGVMDVNKLINEANVSVALAESVVPNYTNSLNDVKSKHMKIEDFIKSNITYTLESIRFKISHARSLANLAPIAAKFGPNTTVSLDSSFVEGESTNTVDMNLKTEAKDGLLMYSGGSSNQSRRRRQASGQSAPISYISLELKDGFVVFTAGVGSEMLSVKSPQSVANNKWHKIKAIRSYALLKLEVQRVNGTGAKQVVSSQSPALINLKLSKSSAVFLGGIPPGNKVLSSITRKNYVGSMDHVLIDGNVRGIWNGKYQQNLKGAIQQKLQNLLPSLQFFGDGFMKYEFADAANKFRKVKFSFRTLQKDALLLYGVDNDYPEIFASFELKNGALVYRYNNGLGKGEQVVSSEGKIAALNDGKRHNVAKGKGSMKIDGKSVASYDKSSQDISATLAFVGGVPFGTNMKSSKITKAAFKGCFISEKASQIIGVSGQRYIDATKQLYILDFKNYKHGCSDYVAKAASFDSPTSYLAINASSCSFSSGKSLGFSFQTYKLRTVLFYGQGKGDAVLSLIINDDGAISMSVKSGPNNAILLVTDKKGLNDGKWHLIRVEQTDKRMKLTVDGQDKIVSINQNIALSGKMYLGGLPPTLTIDGITTYSLDGNMKNIFCDGSVIDLGLGSLEINQVTLAERELAPLTPPSTQPPTTAAPATRGTLPVLPPDPIKKSTPMTFSDSTATTKEVDTVMTKDTQTTTKESVVMTTKLPMPTKEVMTTTKAPMTTKEAMTTKEIVMTTTAAQPTTTKAAPPTTTQPPPPTTTQAPVTTTQAPPPTTTQAPNTTQPPPPTTTKAPVTTTQPPPPTTTQPPPPTTTMPPTPTTTQPPPPTTTQPPPPSTTQPPPPTTTQASTTTMTPTTMAPTPPKIVPCALSGMPSGQGLGFGLAAQSYKPFSFKHGGYMYKSSKFSFSLSTFSPNGILIISSKKNDVYDYEIVYLEGGKVKYIFNAGSGSGEITSAKTINDGKWHTITTTRKLKDGTLTVDGATVSGRSPGSATALNSILKVYVGGAPSNLNTLGKMPKDTRVSIQGCIRDLKFKDKIFTSYKKEEAVGVTGCFSSYSKGLFVGSNGGYGTVKGNKIGKKRTIGLTVRSRSKDGVLYYIGRKKYDYVVIELVKGEIVVNVQNGAGSFNTKIGPPPGQTFCDGLPHEIKVEKDGNKVKLTVNELPPVSVTGPTGSTSVDTGDVSYFGGVPGSLTIFGVKSKKSMNGCISKFTMDGKDYTSRIVPVGLASYGCENVSP